MKFFKQKVSGMSLVELLVGAGIFVMVMGISASTGIMIYKGKAKIQYTNELYSETRFMMERLIRDIRVNTIDYPEYFSQNLGTGLYSEEGNLSSTPGEYGENAGKYEMFFYYIPHSKNETPLIPKNIISDNEFSWKTEDRNQDINTGIFNTGADDHVENDTVNKDTLEKNQYSALLEDNSLPSYQPYTKKGLYLLSADGMIKTIFRYNASKVDPETGEVLGIIEMAKMQLIDSNSDGQYDKWEYIHDFTTITPPNIIITNFTFFLSPLDDPHKSYAKNDENGKTVHIQPHVIVRISAKLREKNARSILGENNEFSLQSTASSRIFYNVTFPNP